MKVSVVGLGRLGAPLAACLASKGFQTIAVDQDAAKVKAVNEGRAPVFEPGLAALIESSKSTLSAMPDLERAVLETDLTFIVVATPSEEQGGFSLRYVLPAIQTIGAALKKKSEYHVVVLTSTVMPGSTGGSVLPALEAASGKKCGVDFGLCYSPEFIALGTVIRDFLKPDFLLIGESDAKAGGALQELYGQVCENKPPVARMSFVNAELTKLAVNTYVTTKITFANLLARMCEKLPGANVDVVTSALGLDSRIGKKYLKGAIGYGGPCFPRDNQALASLARSLEVSALPAESTDEFNRMQVRWLAEVVRGHLPPKGKVGILGLAYKPDSEVVEQSQGLLLAEELNRTGCGVVAYDPVATEPARGRIKGAIQFANSAAACVRESNVVVLTTPWEEFKLLSEKEFEGKVLIDCWRMFDAGRLNGSVVYRPLGIGGVKS